MKPILDCTIEEYSSLMTINLESAFHLSQLAHPLLKASGSGSIVHMSSISGLKATLNSAIYGATKGMIHFMNRYSFGFQFLSLEHPILLPVHPVGAINQLTKNLACEWGKDNIRTNSIAPGITRTPLVQHVSFPSILLMSPNFQKSRLKRSDMMNRLQWLIIICNFQVSLESCWSLNLISAVTFLFVRAADTNSNL